MNGFCLRYAPFLNLYSSLLITSTADSVINTVAVAAAAGMMALGNCEQHTLFEPANTKGSLGRPRRKWYNEKEYMMWTGWAVPWLRRLVADLSPRRLGFDPVPIPVAARSKTWVCGRSLAGIVGSNPARGMDVCVVFVV